MQPDKIHNKYPIILLKIPNFTDNSILLIAFLIVLPYTSREEQKYVLLRIENDFAKLRRKAGSVYTRRHR